MELSTDGDAFNYKTDCFDKSTIEVYKKIEEIFNSLLNKYSNLYDVENCSFYYDNKRYCYSAAINLNDKENIIKLSCAYPHLMFQKLYLKNNLEKKGIIKDLYKELLVDNFDFKEFFLQCSVRFTFFHEFRHLMQFENKSNIYSQIRDFEFSFEKHIFEVDADLFSIRYILDYVFDAFENLTNKTEDNFNKLTYLALGSVFSTNLLYYFKDIDLFESRKITNFTDDFYTNQSSHPHNLVRNINIIEFYKENVNTNYNVNKTIVDYLKYSFEICNIFLDNTLESEFNLTAFYFAQLEKNLQKINSYCTFLNDGCEKHEKIIRLRTKYQFL